MKFSAQHRQGQSNTHDTRFGVEINYRPGVPLSKQLDSDNVAAMREVQNRRYDFVERNNNIVLEYKKKSTLRISLPDAIEGESGATIPVTLNVSHASNGIQSVQWSDSAFAAAVARLPEVVRRGSLLYRLIRMAVLTLTVGATARDSKGNASNHAVMTISVTSSNVSAGDSSFTLDGNNNAQISADGQSTYPITLNLKDSNGKPLTGLENDIEMSLEFTPDNNTQRSRSVSGPQLGKVQEISAGVYRSMLTAGSQSGTARVTAKVLGKTFTLNIKQTVAEEGETETDAVLTAAPAEQVVGYNINLQLVAKDAKGNAITGDKTLRFYALDRAEGVDFGAVTEKRVFIALL